MFHMNLDSLSVVELTPLDDIAAVVQARADAGVA